MRNPLSFIIEAFTTPNCKFEQIIDGKIYSTLRSEYVSSWINHATETKTNEVYLYRTKSGQWFFYKLRCDYLRPQYIELVSDEKACDFILSNHDFKQLEKYFPHAMPDLV